MGKANSPIKVLHLVKTAVGATWALRQMAELVKLGVEVHAALPAEGPQLAAYRASGVIIHPQEIDFPIKTLWRLPKMMEDFRRCVGKVDPQIIHSHFVGTTLVMRLALGKKSPIPRIFQVPGPLHLEHPFFRKVEIATAGPMDHWVGSCRWTCDRYRSSGIAAENVHLSYYGTDLDIFASGEKGHLRRTLGIDEKVPIVGMVAFMYAPKRYLGQRRGLKGHEDLIDALSICLQSEPDIRGVIIGGGWNGASGYESRIRAYGRKKCGDRIFFLGTRSDVIPSYRDFNVAVHPSLSENVGGAVESLLLAVPTVASRVGGLPDLVKENETGRLAPPGSPPALAKIILEVLRDQKQAKEMALRGQDLARRLFDVKETASQVLTIYRALLAGNEG